MGNSEYDRIRHKNEKWIKMQKRAQLEKKLREDLNRVFAPGEISEEKFVELLQQALEEEGLA